jgi:hypothetical protein
VWILPGTKILNIIEPGVAPHGLTWSAGHVWTVSSMSPVLSRYAEATARGLPPVKEIVHGLKNPSGIAHAGPDLLVSEKVEKIVYKIDPIKKTQQVYMNLPKLKKSAATPILKAKGTTVPAIAFNAGDLWVTCQAGYSSSIFCFDGKTKELTRRFFARGPEPLGLSFEPDGKLGWVLDGSNRELSQFDLTGIWTTKVLNVSLMKPSGLAIDAEKHFWVADLQTKKIYQLEREV